MSQLMASSSSRLAWRTRKGGRQEAAFMSEAPSRLPPFLWDFCRPARLVARTVDRTLPGAPSLNATELGFGHR